MLTFPWTFGLIVTIITKLLIINNCSYITNITAVVYYNITRGFIKFVSRWWKVKVGGGALRPGMGY